MWIVQFQIVNANLIKLFSECVAHYNLPRLIIFNKSEFKVMPKLFELHSTTQNENLIIYSLSNSHSMLYYVIQTAGFPGGSDGKESA